MERTKQCVRIGGPLDNVMWETPTAPLPMPRQGLTFTSTLRALPPRRQVCSPRKQFFGFCNGQSVPTGSQHQ